MNAISIEQQRLKVAELVILATGAIFMLMVALSLSYLMYWDDAPPFKSGEVHTENMMGERQTKFKAGEVFLVHRDLCFTRDAAVQYGRRLISVDEPKINIFLNSESTMLIKGCRDNANLLKIPDFAPARKYYLQVVLSYSNNPFQNSASIFPMPIIEVVK